MALLMKFYFKIMKKTFILFCLMQKMMIGYAQGYVYDSTEIQILDDSFRGSRSGLPKIFSLRSFADAPQHQGTRPFCVSWAITEAWTIQKRATKKNKILFSSAFLIHHLHKSTYDQPVSIHQGLMLLKQKGLLSNYDSYLLPPTLQDSLRALENRISGFGAFFDNRFRHQTPEVDKRFWQTIKLLISQHQPVIVGLEVNEDFQKGSLGIWQGCKLGEKTLKHAVCIIGYNDEKKVFEIMNSWGTTWADNGFGRISYDAMFQNTLQAFYIKK